MGNLEPVKATKRAWLVKNTLYGSFQLFYDIIHFIVVFNYCADTQTDSPNSIWLSIVGKDLTKGWAVKRLFVFWEIKLVHSAIEYTDNTINKFHATGVKGQSIQRALFTLWMDLEKSLKTISEGQTASSDLTSDTCLLYTSPSPRDRG